MNILRLEPEGFIYQELKKDMTAEDLREDLPVIDKLAQKLKEQNLPLRVLVNANGIKKASTEMRQVGVDNLKKMGYAKMALYGLPNAYMAHMVNFVLIASGQAAKIKVLQNPEKAKEWLLA